MTEGEYGPNTAEVEALIEKIKTITPKQIDKLGAALGAARGEALGAALGAALEAACALVVRDLISEEDFDLLYGPWKIVMEEEG